MYFPPSNRYLPAALIGTIDLPPSHSSLKSLYATTSAFMKPRSKSVSRGNLQSLGGMVWRGKKLTDCACCLRCETATGDRPAADFFLARCEVVLQAEFCES